MFQAFRFRITYLDSDGVVQMVKFKTTDPKQRERWSNRGWLDQVARLYAADGLTILTTEYFEQVEVETVVMNPLAGEGTPRPGGEGAAAAHHHHQQQRRVA